MNNSFSFEFELKRAGAFAPSDKLLDIMHRRISLLELHWVKRRPFDLPLNETPYMGSGILGVLLQHVDRKKLAALVGDRHIVSAGPFWVRVGTNGKDELSYIGKMAPPICEFSVSLVDHKRQEEYAFAIVSPTLAHAYERAWESFDDTFDLVGDEPIDFGLPGGKSDLFWWDWRRSPLLRMVLPAAAVIMDALMGGFMKR